MKLEDQIIAENDARLLLKEQFGDECELVMFNANKYYEMKVIIGGVAFHCYSCLTLKGAVNALVSEFREHMRFPRRDHEYELERI